MSCPVCADTFTKELRKPIPCPYCEFAACAVCAKRYLTEGGLDAHCMSCRRAWNDDFLDLNFTKAFRTGPYKVHRENILFERELSILPTRQIRVEAKLKCREVEKDMKKVYEELTEWEKGRAAILRKSTRLSALLTRYSAESEGRAPPAWTLAEGGGAAPATERAKFIMKCPAEGCRGFLSSAYKCGTCQMWACSDCLVIKGKEKDAEHTCDPGQKESVAMIIKESRPCPKCGERISKIDGCDQMFCVECHTAFSWNTGQVVNGVIHNPHYYEFLRKQGNGVAPRNAGDVPCGGVPYYAHLQRAIGRLNAMTQRSIMGIHRITAEIADQRIQGFQGAFNMNDNGDLGVLYLLNELDKDKMKVELAKREFKRAKSMAIRAILEMFVNTSTMMLNAIVSAPPASEEAFATTMAEFVGLREYVNRSLLDVSRMKACSVPQIGPEWQWKPHNKAPAQPKISAKRAAAEANMTPEEKLAAFEDRRKKRKEAEERKKKREAAATSTANGSVADDSDDESVVEIVE